MMDFTKNKLKFNQVAHGGGGAVAGPVAVHLGQEQGQKALAQQEGHARSGH